MSCYNVILYYERLKGMLIVFVNYNMALYQHVYMHQKLFLKLAKNQQYTRLGCKVMKEKLLYSGGVFGLVCNHPVMVLLLK